MTLNAKQKMKLIYYNWLNNTINLEILKTLRISNLVFFHEHYFHSILFHFYCFPIYLWNCPCLNVEHSNVIAEGLNRIADRFSGVFFLNVYEYILRRDTERYSHTCRFHDKGAEPLRFCIILLSKWLE